MSKPKTPRGALRIITADERVRAILTTAGSADPDARVRASADLIERVNGLIKERDEARADGAMRTAERDAARARCDLLEQDRDRWKSRAERAERVVCDDDESDGTDCMHCGCPSVPQARGAGRHLVQRHSRRGEPISGEDDEWDYRGHAGDVAIYQLFAVRGLNLLVAPSEVPVITAMSKEAEVITAAVFETVMRSTPRARLLDLFDGSRGDAMAVVVDGEVAPYDTWLMNLALRALPVDDISASDVGVGRARGAAQGAICMAVKRGGISYVATVMPLDATVVEVVQLPRLDLDAEVSRVGE